MFKNEIRKFNATLNSNSAANYSCVQPKRLMIVSSNATSTYCFLLANHIAPGSNAGYAGEEHRFHFEAPQFVVCVHHLMCLVHL